MIVKITPENKSKIKKMFDKGKGAAEISNLLGIKRGAVQYHITNIKKENNIPLKTRKLSKKVTPEIKAEIKRMLVAGKGAAEMSRLLNINANTIKYHIDNFNGITKKRNIKNPVAELSTAKTQTVTQKVSAVVGYIHDVPVRFDIAFFSSIKEIIISKHGFVCELKDGTTRSFGE